MTNLLEAPKIETHNGWQQLIAEKGFTTPSIHDHIHKYLAYVKFPKEGMPLLFAHEINQCNQAIPNKRNIYQLNLNDKTRANITKFAKLQTLINVLQLYRHDDPEKIIKEILREYNSIPRNCIEFVDSIQTNLLINGKAQEIFSFDLYDAISTANTCSTSLLDCFHCEEVTKSKAQKIIKAKIDQLNKDKAYIAKCIVSGNSASADVHTFLILPEAKMISENANIKLDRVVFHKAGMGLANKYPPAGYGFDFATQVVVGYFGNTVKDRMHYSILTNGSRKNKHLHFKLIVKELE